MTVTYLAIDAQVRLHALYADVLPTDNMNNGDRAIISDGPDKLFIDGAWVDDGEDEGNNDQLQATYLASAARTASVTNGADIDTRGYRFLEVEFEATAFSATPSVVATIQGKTLSGA